MMQIQIKAPQNGNSAQGLGKFAPKDLPEPHRAGRVKSQVRDSLVRLCQVKSNNFIFRDSNTIEYINQVTVTVSKTKSKSLNVSTCKCSRKRVRQKGESR